MLAACAEPDGRAGAHVFQAAELQRRAVPRIWPVTGHGMARVLCVLSLGRASELVTLSRAFLPIDTVMRNAASPVLILVFAVAVASGCVTKFIPNTDVVDNPDNRQVVAFCEAYRRAVERKDLVTLVELASPQYYEDGGNVDASDDIDYAGLRQYLTKKFSEAKSIRYEIRYRRVSRGPDVVLVDYTYSGSYRLPSKGGGKWRSTVEENRLELVASGDSFKIVAGM